MSLSPRSTAMIRPTSTLARGIHGFLALFLALGGVPAAANAQNLPGGRQRRPKRWLSLRPPGTSVSCSRPLSPARRAGSRSS
jgi:hypothetical protein